jgi:membrane protease YdiL (CAAX protease family)
MTTAADLFTRQKPGFLLGRIIQFPLIRIVIAFLFLAVYLIPHNKFIVDAIATTSGTFHSILVRIDDFISILILFFIYRLYARSVENRKAHEIALSGAISEFSVGFGISLILVGGMVLLLTALGYYRVSSADSPSIILHAFFRFGIGAFAQVLLFRLILLRLLEEWLGSWLAMFIVALTFGLLHLANANASVFRCSAIILSDVLLIAAFYLTRRLWLVWGIHFGWNFLQDGIFGMPNSGETQFPSWLTSTVDGPEWLTGGTFGIEASYVSVGLNLIVGILLLSIVIRKGQIVRPKWQRVDVA